MNSTTYSQLRLGFVTALAVAASACASLGDTLTPTLKEFDKARTSPTLPIVRNMTSFEGGLQCTAKMMSEQSTRLSLGVEDIVDKTQKSPAGTTEMFLSALSTISARNPDIRFVDLSADASRNTAVMIAKAGIKGPNVPENIPTFVVSGAISQFDDALVKTNKDLGVSVAGRIGGAGGGSKSSSVSEIGLDLKVLRTQDLALVGGANSRNKAAILQDGWGRDADVSIIKVGINYQTSLSRSDGKSVALRNLVDLAAIEVIGRLTKSPYWRCIGQPFEDPGVQKEIEAWFQSMSAQDKVLFFWQALRAMGVLGADAAFEAEDFKLAYGAYAEALGLPGLKSISLEMFLAHFKSDTAAVAEKTVALFQAARRKPIPLTLKLEPAAPANEPRITVTSAGDAFLYCFVQDEADRRVRGLYPNGAKRIGRVPGGRPIALGALAGRPGLEHPHRDATLACFTSRIDRTKDLPALFKPAPGSVIPNLTLEQIQAQLASGGLEPGVARLRLAGPGRNDATGRKS